MASIPPPILATHGLTHNGRLNLSGRSLTELPTAEIAASAATLHALDVASNALGDAFTLPENLPVLLELRLADNVITSQALQRASPLPPSLRVLDVGANRLTLLPPCVLRLPALLVLKVDKQRLRALPPELSMLGQLSELEAGFNELRTALPLASPGLPRLRRLGLRSNGLTSGALALDANTLPSLTELDLAGNALTEWPATLGTLESLRVLHLGNNRLQTLASASTEPHRRLWVPTAGVHTLTMLVELSVAQNHLAELPSGLSQLRAIRRLDVRCNPLSRPSLSLATRHCEQCAATCLHSSIARVAPGLLLGDESSAWHRPTLLRAHVGVVLSIGSALADGVPLARLEAKLPIETRLIGLGCGWSGEEGGGSDAAGGSGANGTAAGGSGAAGGSEGDAAGSMRVTEASLRRAFHSCALRLHPDKVAPEKKEEAAIAFATLLEAYKAVGRQVGMERRRLPELDGFKYAFVDVPRLLLPAAEGASAATDEACAAALKRELPAALAFVREARGDANGELLVHPTSGHAHTALAILLALLMDRDEGPTSLESAMSELASSLGREALPELPVAVCAVLRDLASDRLRGRVRYVPPSSTATNETATSGTDADTTNADAGTTPSGAASGGDDHFGGSGSAGTSTYAPTLSICDPFEGDDPFANLSLAPSEVESHGADDGGSGGGGRGRSVETATSTAPMPTYGVDDAGWHVDSEGRKVHHTPGARRFETVVVEYAEGARRKPGPGGFVG